MSRSSHGTTDLARRVLVGGESMADVAREAGVSKQAIFKVVSRVRGHLETAREIQSRVKAIQGEAATPISAHQVGSLLLPVGDKGAQSPSVLAAGEVSINGLTDAEAGAVYGVTYQSVLRTRQLIAAKYELSLKVAAVLNEGDHRAS